MKKYSNWGHESMIRIHLQRVSGFLLSSTFLGKGGYNNASGTGSYGSSQPPSF